jgi:gamma-glutamyltranspeptidase/glutathione hydrolase
MRDIHLAGRSVCHGIRGVAATSQPLATLAAIDILRSGGNAIDAAIAACAVLCVVEPMGTGIGGDCFALCWIARENRLVAINGSGHSPTALTLEQLRSSGHETIGETSVHAVTVPGAIDAWCRLNADYGKLPMAAVLEPAIHYAEHGFAVSPVVALEWSAATKKLSADANTARFYLPGGRSPRAGEIMKLPALASALRRVAEHGRDGFYRGPLAREMVDYLDSLGGLHSLDDFATQTSLYVEPVRSRYRDVEVIEMPPNSQGLVASLMLNILSGFDLAGHAPLSVERFHLVTEAARLAFRVRDDLVADPAASNVSTDHVLSEEFARSLRSRIDLKQAMPYPTAFGDSERDTVCLSVIDEDRNVCSFINSLYFQFGSALTSPDSAIMFHNRGVGFQLKSGHPNCVGPRKRPSHTLLPAMAFKAGQPWLSFASKGAAFQPIGQVSVLTAIVDNGLDIQEAVDVPRCGYNNNDRVEAERGVPQSIREGLSALGHPVVDARGPLGGAQVVQIDAELGTVAGASDPRKDGTALSY